MDWIGAEGASGMKKAIQILMALLLVAGLYLGAPNAAWAQDDPPGRVAQLNFTQGGVSVQPAGTDNWFTPNPNSPLTTGDNVWSDEDSRAELHIGSTAIRLASMTGISFLNLDDRTVQIQLALGKIEIHVRRLDAGTAFEIDTPNLSFTLTRRGEYTISTDQDGTTTTVIVREGAGEAAGGGESVDLAAGDRYTFRGTDQLTYDSGAAPAFDDFENWSEARDQHENQSQSAQHVSRDVDGYYDLDDNGTWQTDSDYGYVWYPSGVAVGWVPYRNGHFVWLSPWGWTWVGEEPWGFAPYHFGRWAFVGNAWGWVPGPLVVRPVYSPAMVAFVGGGGTGVAVGFGGGVSGVAWFPLGPRDVWVPGYRASARYVQNANITNTKLVGVAQVTPVYNYVNEYKTVNLTQMNYMYANHAEAITAVRRADFVSVRPVARVAVKVAPEQFEGAWAVVNTPVAAPAHGNLGARVPIAKVQPPAPFTQRQVVTKISPPMPASQGHVYTNDSKEFSEGAARIQANAARANDNAAAGRTNNNSPVGRSATGNPNEAQTQAHPSTRFTPPVKAKEDMYDVHPPLNEKAAPPPKEEHAAEKPAPKEQPKAQPKAEPAPRPPKL